MINGLLLSLLLILLWLSTSFAATQDRLPTANATDSNWTYSGSTSGCTSDATKWACVDDPIGSHDSATTYVYRQTSNSNQMFEYTDFNINSTAITNIILTYICQYTGGDGLNIVARIQVNGTEYTGTADAITTSWASYSNTWTTNPNTSLAWTEADVEGTGAAPLQEFGINPTSIVAGEEAQCTQVYITVTYDATPTNPALFNSGEDWE